MHRVTATDLRDRLEAAKKKHLALRLSTLLEDGEVFVEQLGSELAETAVAAIEQGALAQVRLNFSMTLQPFRGSFEEDYIRETEGEFAEAISAYVKACVAGPAGYGNAQVEVGYPAGLEGGIVDVTVLFEAK